MLRIYKDVFDNVKDKSNFKRDWKRIMKRWKISLKGNVLRFFMLSKDNFEDLSSKIELRIV